MSNRKYYYGLIANAQELKTIHDEAKLNGKQGVGLSRGKNFYIWDENIGNIRTIKPEEAATRLGLTIAQIDQIVATNGEISFEDPEPIADVPPVIEELGPIEEFIAQVAQTPVDEEIALETPKNEQPEVVIYPAAPEESGDKHTNNCKCKARKALNEIIESLTRLRDSLGEE